MWAKRGGVTQVWHPVRSRDKERGRPAADYPDYSPLAGRRYQPGAAVCTLLPGVQDCTRERVSAPGLVWPALKPLLVRPPRRAHGDVRVGGATLETGMTSSPAWWRARRRGRV
jgi:hypothetical protein